MNLLPLAPVTVGIFMILKAKKDGWRLAGWGIFVAGLSWLAVSMA